MSPIDERLKTLGIVLPDVMPPTLSGPKTSYAASPHGSGIRGKPLVTIIYLDAADGAAMRPSGYRDGRR